MLILFNITRSIMVRLKIRRPLKEALTQRYTKTQNGLHWKTTKYTPILRQRLLVPPPFILSVLIAGFQDRTLTSLEIRAL